jgi:hypothetical protein
MTVAQIATRNFARMAQANDSAGTPRYCWSESDGSLNYFTNDYNENDQQTARRGRQRLQTFQTDPARFFGQNALNLAPLGSSHRSSVLRASKFIGLVFKIR